MQAWTEAKNLKSTTQSNHIQIVSQNQTEGLLTRHRSVLQLEIQLSNTNLNIAKSNSDSISLFLSYLKQQ